MWVRWRNSTAFLTWFEAVADDTIPVEIVILYGGRGVLHSTAWCIWRPVRLRCREWVTPPQQSISCWWVGRGYYHDWDIWAELEMIVSCKIRRHSSKHTSCISYLDPRRYLVRSKCLSVWTLEDSEKMCLEILSRGVQIWNDTPNDAHLITRHLVLFDPPTLFPQ